jgi:hypothetical protein
MTERARILIRMADVVFALSTAHDYRERLGKLRLQKFIYLTDAVSLLYSFLPPLENHTTYMHGPYDVAIQRAVDSLAFRGFVVIHGIRPNPGGVAADYGLSEGGRQLASRLKEEMESQWYVFRDVANQVDRIGWQHLRALAYAEPTFVTARSYGYGQTLELADGLANSSALVLASIDRVLENEAIGRRPTRELVASLFFRYLREYSTHSKLPPEEHVIGDGGNE